MLSIMFSRRYSPIAIFLCLSLISSFALSPLTAQVSYASVVADLQAATITYDTLDDAAYENERFEVMKILEETEHEGNISLTIYFDSKDKPTIGVGMNLREPIPRDAVFNEILGIDAPQTLQNNLIAILNNQSYSLKTMQSELDKEMAQAHENNPSIRSTFTFENAEEVKRVFDMLAPIYEAELDRLIEFTVPRSEERIALLSLSWNNANELIGENLRGFMKGNNRIGAWYEIRYKSNGGDSRGSGIAKRRYYESDYFELYNDPANVAEDEALNAGRYYTENRELVRSYDNTYGHMIAKANEEYKTTIVKEIEVHMQPSVQALAQIYNAPSDVQELLVDPGSNLLKGDIAGEPDNLQNDMLIGEDGNDQLDGVDGNDFLIGGQGNDTLNGGDGNDISYFFGQCEEYNIAKVSDESWTVSHARGSQADGTDTLQNIEKLQFTDIVITLPTDGESVPVCTGQDIAFVIDTTGSMSDDIDAVKSEAINIINAIFSEENEMLNSRIAIVSYRDPGQVSTILSFTEQTAPEERKTAAVSGINSIRVGSGGDEPEGVYSGLLHALDGNIGIWRETAVVRRIVLFGDAPPKDYELAEEVKWLASDANVDTPPPPAVVSASTDPIPVEIFTVVVGDNVEAQTAFETIAKENSGRFFTANSATNVTDAILNAVLAPPVAGINTIHGTASDETLYGTENADEIHGLGGNDEIYGEDGPDMLWGDDGNDTIWGSTGNDDIHGGHGNDLLGGDEGDDTLSGEEGDDTLWGWTGNDVLYGGPGNDLMGGDDGDDTLWGWTGDDTLHGGNGNDVVGGDEGDDTLAGEEGDDTLWGWTGNDILYGGAGNDLLGGDEGDDTYIYHLHDDHDTIQDLLGNNRLTFAEGIVSEQVHLSISEDNPADYVIHLEGADDSIALIGQATTRDNGLAEIVFHDGTVWNHAAIHARAEGSYLPENPSIENPLFLPIIHNEN